MHNGPGVDPALNRNEYQEYYMGGRGGQLEGLTTLPPSCGEWKCGNLNLFGTLRTCNRPV